MPLEDFLDQEATITAEAPDGRVPPQDALGGADRSDGNWVTVASGVPCLVREKGSSLDPDRDDARMNVITATVYFEADPVPSGISTRHRITVTATTPAGPQILGLYSVQGTVDPNAMGRIFQVSCERVRIP